MQDVNLVAKLSTAFLGFKKTQTETAETQL